MINTHRIVNTDNMLQSLSKTNDNIATISEGLKLTVRKINNSAALWRLPDDSSLPANTRSALAYTARPAPTPTDSPATCMASSAM